MIRVPPPGCVMLVSKNSVYMDDNAALRVWVEEEIGVSQALRNSAVGLDSGDMVIQPCHRDSLDGTQCAS